MFENFDNSFHSDTPKNNARSAGEEELNPEGTLNEFLARYGGKSFNGGLYRVLRPGDVEAWSRIVTEAFPEFRERLTAFSFDWLGRVFALDTARSANGHPAILLLEPGTGQPLEIPCNFVDFHEIELIEFREAALAESFFKEWLASGNPAPKYRECAGYQRPLFLGGSDDLDNLTIWDLEIYWDISSQLIAKVKHLPPGSALGTITIDE